jgi:hypothetical protein
MKHQMTAAIVSLVFMLTADQALGDLKDYDVMLTTQGPSGTLKAHLGFGQSCAVNWHEGCMNFDVNTTGVITFYLPGPQSQMTCDDPAVNKVITKIELTDKPLQGNPTSPKGDFTGGLAGDWLKTFAFPQVDKSTGVLYLADIATGLARITLVNMNSHPAGLGEKSFWYQVTVTSCDGKNYWVTDPRGDNKGLN